MKKKRKFNLGSIPVFILLVISFWIIWFINCYAWVNSIYIVSDVLNLVLVVGMIIIIVSAILNVIQFVRYHSTLNSTSSGKKIVLFIVLITFITIHLLMYISLSDWGFDSGGVANITNKQEKNDSYYFYVNNIKDNHEVEIECTKGIYEELIVDKNVLYTIEYRWITYNNKGVLKSINTKEFIDNRR